MLSNFIPIVLALLLSIGLIAGASIQKLPFELSLLEAIAVVACAWSVWLLAMNQLLG